MSALFSLQTSGSLQLTTIGTVLLVYGCPMLLPSLSTGFVLSIFHRSEQRDTSTTATNLTPFSSVPSQRSFIEFFNLGGRYRTRKRHSMRSKMYWGYARTYKQGLSPRLRHNKHSIFSDVEVKFKVLIHFIFLISSILHLHIKIIA